MAQAIPNSVIHKIRNALGNVVFYERGGQLYTRARVSPSQTPTTARTRVRANLAAISAAWKSTLTEAQRQAWRTASLTAPQNPQRNNRGTRSGWTYYQQVNLTRLNLSLAQTATPPALQNTDPPTAFSVNTLDAETPSILLDVAGAEGADTYLIVYASPNRPPGYFTANGKTGQVQVFAPGAPRPLDVTAAWATKYGTLTPGSRVNFQIASANAIDGRLTARQYATALATGATDAMQLISEVVIAANGDPIQFAAIPGTYRHLWLILKLRSFGTGIHGATDGRLIINGDTAAHYTQLGNYNGGYNVNTSVFAQTNAVVQNVPDSTAPANSFGGSDVLLRNYADTDTFKTIDAKGSFEGSSTTVGYNWVLHRGDIWVQTTAVTQIDITEGTGSGFAIGSKAALYGIS